MLKSKKVKEIDKFELLSKILDILQNPDYSIVDIEMNYKDTNTLYKGEEDMIHEGSFSMTINYTNDEEKREKVKKVN